MLRRYSCNTTFENAVRKLYNFLLIADSIFVVDIFSFFVLVVLADVDALDSAPDAYIKSTANILFVVFVLVFPIALLNMLIAVICMHFESSQGEVSRDACAISFFALTTGLDCPHACLRLPTAPV